MAITETITCDVCNKEVDRKAHYFTVTPEKYTYKRWVERYDTMQICEECWKTVLKGK